MTVKSQPGSSASVLPEFPAWSCLCLLAVFVLAMLGKVLFISPHEVLSDGRMDLAAEFVPWRYFGFHELKSGNLALWNPHCYCGEPFFGSFQSALLYPLNFLYLLLPLEAAINWTIALNMFLGGVFMFYWVRHRGLHSLACLLAAMMFMFCGPHFLQIQTGHLSNLCTLIWAPLLFLAVDKMVNRPALGPCLLGMFATAMAVFAGHPQYVFYLGVAAGIYAVLNFWHCRQRGKLLLGLVGIVVGGIALSAIQLFTGLGEARESMRSLGMSYEFASIFSFPPENLLTLITPDLFGNGNSVEYWGRWYITDVSLFISVMGLALAVYGIMRGAPATRRFSIVMVIVTLVLGLGCYTPLFHFLFNFVPGFNKFRGMTKFIWLTAMFLSMLAGVGLDQVLRNKIVPYSLILILAGAGIVLCGLAVLPAQLDWWAALLKKFSETKANWWSGAMYVDHGFIIQSQTLAIESLIRGVVCLFATAGLFALARSHRQMACGGMLLMAAIELASFGQTSLMTFQISPAYPPDIAQGLTHNPGDYRIQAERPNYAMMAGTFDVGGDDPTALLRYIRYYGFSRGLDFDNDPEFRGRPKYNLSAWRILRCRYVISERRDAHLVLTNELPRLSLVDHFSVMTNYHEIFTTLTNADFPIDKKIVLERAPVPAPQPDGQKGTAKLLSSSTDDATIEADVTSPCLLFITDAYSSGWRAVALPGSSQSHYDIMPADYCLRAIPLAAGHHFLRMEYSPAGFRLGRAVSIVAWPIFMVWAGWCFFKKSKHAQR